MATVMMPPRTMEIVVSDRLSTSASRVGTDSGHFSWTELACRNRLYGTTVVPIRAATVMSAPEGMLGTNAPARILPTSPGRITMTAVNMNTTLITITSATNTRSMTL
jgi:hypothetical protein